jgi:hypothetical protein
VLALALGGRTIAEWKGCMEQPEFLGWKEFHKLFPLDDLHRIYRPAAAIATCAQGGGDMKPILELLQPDPIEAQLGDVEKGWMRALGISAEGR